MATSAPIITSKGSSKNWRATKKNVLRIFNLFLEESRKQGLKYANEPFEKMPHSVLCNTKLWEWFAGYLTQTYKKPAGTKNSLKNGGCLSIFVARNYFSTMMHLAKEKCYQDGAKTTDGVDPQIKLFFSCLDGGKNEQGKWFQGVRKNILRFLFQKQHKTGGTLDSSVTPVYQTHIQDACDSLTAHGYTPENSRRKLTLISLRQVAGRSSEMSWLLMESFTWCPLYRQVFAELPESKPSKMKLCVFVAGKKSELCFFTALGDMLAHNDSNFLNPVGEENESVTPLSSKLHTLSKPGSKIGSYLQQLRPNETGVYREVGKISLRTATAQGIYLSNSC